jgi:enterochelin esterase-like enzyme
MDSLVAATAIPEFLVIMPDANNALEASFYANSPVTGGWEDFVVRDLVGSIDRTYRTDGRAVRRAIAGHSMGGFGALALGFRHPATFGLIYAMSPCCLAFVGQLDPASPAWLTLARVIRWQDAPPLLIGLAAAFSGSTTNPRLFDELPFGPGADGKIGPNPDVEARWLARIPPDLASAMVKRGNQQPVIYLEAGSEETSIRAGIQVLRSRLDSLGIRYADTTFAGGHIDRVRQRISKHLLPTVGRWFTTSPQ